jgi:hypothetical protein
MIIAEFTVCDFWSNSHDTLRWRGPFNSHREEFQKPTLEFFINGLKL